MNDPAMNNLLRWGVENSEAGRDANPDGPKTQLSSDAVAALFGAGRKSDAELMKENMALIQSGEASLEDKIRAFDDFEQLVESIDNANNLEPLQLWMPLVEQLEHDEAELRMYAAWCCGIAVQNNLKSQERMLILGAIPTLVQMATQDTEQKVRKKAILALSSLTRNFQPGLDAAVSHMPEEFKPKEKLDANNMESVDSLIGKLRENA